MTTQTPQQEEFKNELIQVKVGRNPQCLIELEVHATPAIIDIAQKKAIKNINKEATLPGFRKGKAPEEMILRKFGPQVEKELHTQVANVAYVEAQKNLKIPLLNNNSQIVFKMVKEPSAEGADLSFTFETEPTIPSVEPTLFDAKPVDRPEVTETQINEAIRQMQFFFADWKHVTDRSIQDGDYITIDLETIENDVEQKVFDHIRFEVSKERMANWMKQLVTGAKQGDVLEGMSEADDTASEEEKKEFQPKKVRLTIHSVEEATLPELNDEFSQKVGAKDVEAMRKSVSDLLNSKADEKVDLLLRDQVADFLVQQYPFDLPKSLVETEKKHRLSQHLKDPKFKNEWEGLSKEERSKVEEKLELEANQAVRLFYLSRKVVSDANISITHKEIQDEAVATMQSYGQRNNDAIPREIYALAMSKVFLAKAQNHILAAKK